MKKLNVLLVAVSVLSMVFTSSAFAAIVTNDYNSGPGVGLFYDNSTTAKIYGYGDIITGIEGNAVNEQNTNDYAPTTVESNILNPIDYSIIDMGPTSGYYGVQGYLHSINDGGPGMGVPTNELGNPTYYNDGGPGMGLSISTYVDPGPIYEGLTTANIDPSMALSYWGPGANSFVGSSKEDKLGK